MGAYDFTWNAIQSGQIRDLDERIDDLEKDMATARAWIEYLTKRIDELENERTN
jgi:polyhydroxyalkanoate synthesis regulator phasin